MKVKPCQIWLGYDIGEGGLPNTGTLEIYIFLINQIEKWIFLLLHSFK